MLEIEAQKKTVHGLFLSLFCCRFHALQGLAGPLILKDLWD